MTEAFKVKESPMITHISDTSPLILASSSRYRAKLLARLRVPFVGLAPDIDETPLSNESAEDLTQRLAFAKAQKLARLHPGRWVLGSDQAAVCEGQILGKPGTHERAATQLSALSGQRVEFLTAVTLINGTQSHHALDLTVVHVRLLTAAAIERYLAAEPAYDCAGSFKCEGLGISLFEQVQSSDPTGLIGLPLIAVADLLRKTGLDLP